VLLQAEFKVGMEGSLLRIIICTIRSLVQNGEEITNIIHFWRQLSLTSKQKLFFLYPFLRTRVKNDIKCTICPKLYPLYQNQVHRWHERSNSFARKAVTQDQQPDHQIHYRCKRLLECRIMSVLHKLLESGGNRRHSKQNTLYLTAFPCGHA